MIRKEKKITEMLSLVELVYDRVIKNADNSHQIWGSISKLRNYRIEDVNAEMQILMRVGEKKETENLKEELKVAKKVIRHLTNHLREAKEEIRVLRVENEAVRDKKWMNNGQ